MSLLRYRDWLSVIILIGGLWILFELRLDAQTRERAAYDQAELYHVKYGLLNPTKWIEVGGVVLERKIDHYELTESDRSNITLLIERALRSTQRSLDDHMPALAAELARLIRDLDYKTFCPDEDCINWVPYESAVFDFVKPRLARWVEGRAPDLVRRALATSLDDQERRRLSTLLTGLLVEYLHEPESRMRFKRMMRDQLEDFKSKVASEVDRSALKRIFATYGCAQRVPCQGVVDGHIKTLDERMKRGGLGLLGVVLLVFMVTLGSRLGKKRRDQRDQRDQINRRDERRSDQRDVSLLLVSSTLLWLGGILLPMLEMQAKISRLDLMIDGDRVSFVNEVIFYQSKSILDFVWIMMHQGEPAMIVVGVLIGLFSVVFPLVKLICSLLALRTSTNPPLHDPRSPARPSIVDLIALHSGKWSMTDVMVVAIFMAYIGFGRMIHTQFAQLSAAAERVSLIDGEGTRFEVGFFLFLGFCLASQLASVILGQLRSRSASS